MNIDKLKQYIKTTNIIANYRRVCDVLEINVLTGNAKISQLKELERFFKFNKDGNKFVFTETYKIPLVRIDNRKGNSGKSEGSRNNNTAEYIDNIEKLILNLLVQGSNVGIGFGKVFLSKNCLLKELKMINNNYPYCKERIPKLSKFMNISLENVEEWYTLTGDMLERNLECALKSLENQSLVLWSKEITVAKATPIAEIIENGKQIIKTITTNQFDEEVIGYRYSTDNRITLSYREGTEEEKTYILKIEREILKELNCKSKQIIIQKGMWEAFKNKVDKIVLKELDIAFYYKSYKILFNEEHVIEAEEDLEEDLYEKYAMFSSDKTKEQDILNKSFIDRNMSNINKRHNNAMEEISKILWIEDDLYYERLIRRSDENYISDNIKLNDNLIDQTALNIKNNVKRTKILKATKSSKIMDELFGELDK